MLTTTADKTSEAGGTLAATTYLMKNYMRTAQGFAEYEWRALRDLSINAGLRYAHFRRRRSWGGRAASRV